MTLEEKLGQLTQVVEDQLPNPLAGSILNSGGAAHINELQRGRKIPLLAGYDVIHGYRTIFPIPLAIASSWDPSMAELSARVAAREARAAGIRWTFAPMVDIARDPRWGRVAEGAGEDPFLGSAMAAAYVRGFQSEPGFLACAKHYAAYGAAEGGRDYDRADISEATLREVYLPPFQAAVDAGVASLMAAFESLNGTPANANRHLLTEILREEWKFSGFVVSDWDAIAELMNHGVALSKEEAARKAIVAGVDMDMWDNTYATLAEAVRGGRLPVAVIDRAVRRVLRAKLRAGLFDHSLEDERAAPPMDRDAARRVARESIVLLRNQDHLLPLPKSGRRVAVVGPLANSKEDMLGPWSALGRAEECVSVLEGIRAVIGEPVPAEQAEVIVAVFGETRHMSGEAASRTSLDLPGDQEAELQSLVATGKPVVLVLLSGRPLSITWAAQHVPAIVEAWFPGSEGGHAIADVLFGDVNPSAKLPVTVPRTVGQVPIYYAHLPTGRPPNPDDKYTSKYLDVPIGPLYPFGFGLSYTKFEYSDLRVDGLKFSATVRNAGDRAGEEIVQMYIRDPVASLSRPVKELKGFQRIALKPGEARRVEFTIRRRDLRFWSGKGWTVEPGEYKVWIGPSSDEGLEGKFQPPFSSQGGEKVPRSGLVPLPRDHPLPAGQGEGS